MSKNKKKKIRKRKKKQREALEKQLFDVEGLNISTAEEAEGEQSLPIASPPDYLLNEVLAPIPRVQLPDAGEGQDVPQETENNPPTSAGGKKKNKVSSAVSYYIFVFRRKNATGRHRKMPKMWVRTRRKKRRPR